MITYKDSGVDISKGDEIKKKIGELVKETYKRGLVLKGVGPFSAVLSFGDKVLLATADGVGTKIKLALEYGNLKGIGKDLVAMCVNDIIAMNGKPLFFLDYIGVNFLEEKILEVVEGMISALKESDCSLVGGETAQMPEFYNNTIELVGFAIGICKKNNLPKKPKKGDIIFAFPSSGVHSNGFSLIRKLIEMGFLKNIVEKLLIPTKIYVKDFFKLQKKVGYPVASAHITGGGIIGNVSRIITKNVNAIISKEKIKEMREKEGIDVFDEISKYVSEEEMWKVFNMGAGFILIYPEEKAKKIRKLITQSKIKIYEIGFIDKGNGSVILK